MRVLILDDMVQRHDGFKILFAGHELHHAYTTNEARRFLEEHQFDALFLDHDLNEYIPGMYGSTEVTGYDFCRWLVTTALGTSVDEHIPITIHSWNPEGARRMRNVLWDGGFLNVTISPFSSPVVYTREEEGGM